MAQTAKRTNLAPNQGAIVVRLLLLAVVFYFVIAILQAQTEISAQQAQLDALETQAVEQQQKNEALREQVEDGISEEYIASLARSEYDYVQPNERIYIDSSSD